jgi:hypothetical protein
VLAVAVTFILVTGCSAVLCGWVGLYDGEGAVILGWLPLLIGAAPATWLWERPEL